MSQKDQDYTVGRIAFGPIRPVGAADGCGTVVVDVAWYKAEISRLTQRISVVPFISKVVSHKALFGKNAGRSNGTISKLIATLAIALLPLIARAQDSWTTLDVALEASYQVTAVADWAQTRWMTAHWHDLVPGTVPNSWYERSRRELNPFLGPYPSIGRVNNYFLAAGLTHLAITALLPSRWRPVWEAAGIVFELGIVGRNAAAGVHFDF